MINRVIEGLLEKKMAKQLMYNNDFITLLSGLEYLG